MVFSLVVSECLRYVRHKCSKIALFYSLCLTEHFDYETSLIKGESSNSNESGGGG